MILSVNIIYHTCTSYLFSLYKRISLPTNMILEKNKKTKTEQLLRVLRGNKNGNKICTEC